MAWRRVPVYVLAFVATVGAQGPGAPAPDRAARAAIDSALHWIVANSTYAAVPLRHWVVLKAADMPARARTLNVADDPRAVYGMFDCATDTLYFQRDADLRDPVVFSFLVHEVTHHLQCRSGRMGKDLCAWEREAYGMQGAYLRSVVEAGVKDGKRLNSAQLTAARTTEADLDRRTDIACADLRAR
jgi:hypothetical protein